MNRRSFIATAAATVTLRESVWAQSERFKRVGLLIPFPKDDAFFQSFVAAFVQELMQLGWVEGGNIQFDYRYAAGDPNLFKTYAAELVGLSPDAILASTLPAVAPLRDATRTIPIVFVLEPDPVALGLVQSLARPGGNLTGFSSFDAQLLAKWLQLLKEVAPGLARVSVLFDPAISAGTNYAPLFNRTMEAAGPSIGITVTGTPVRNDQDIEEAAAAQAREPGGGLITLPDSFIASRRDVIVAAAARHSLPLMGMADVFPKTGALMSYGFDPIDVHRRAASYVDRILKGASPADLPVQEPASFSLVINLKTAKALGLTMPHSLLQRADEVIE